MRSFASLRLLIMQIQLLESISMAHRGHKLGIRKEFEAVLSSFQGGMNRTLHVR